MKGTRHNGRSGKNGVYNPLHNDRRFNPEHSEHIDNERVRQNIYWDCYQGYTTMEDQGKENNFSFEQIELAFYEEHYGNYVMKQNERHVKARHPDRCKEVEDVWKNKKTCPEESIYQLGTIDEHASVETLILVFDEFKKEFDKRFGSLALSVNSSICSIASLKNVLSIVMYPPMPVLLFLSQSLCCLVRRSLQYPDQKLSVFHLLPGRSHHQHSSDQESG